MKNILLISLLFSSFAYASPSPQCAALAVSKVKKACEKEWMSCELHKVNFVEMTPSKVTYMVEMTALGYDMVEDWDHQMSLKYKTTATGIVCF